MSKGLVLSCAIAIGALPLATLPADGQTVAPFDRRAAWFASLPDGERDVVINEVRAQYYDRIEHWRGLSSEQKRAVVDGVRTQRQVRERYRAWAWRDWRTDRGCRSGGCGD